MKIVVIGGTGLIGSKLVSKLSADGHEALAASPARGTFGRITATWMGQPTRQR